MIIIKVVYHLKIKILINCIGYCTSSLSILNIMPRCSITKGIIEKSLTSDAFVILFSL